MDSALILQRLAERAADLAEAQAVHDYWLTKAEGAGLITRRGYRRVADGQGGFSEEPIPSVSDIFGREWDNLNQSWVTDPSQPQSATASSGSQARP